MASIARPWVTALRGLLFVGGVGLVVWLVRGVGVDRVLAVFRENWAWIPVVALLEMMFVSMDLVSLRVLLGPSARRVSLSLWVRSTAVAYASTILLPAGRAAGEAGRAATISPSVGAADAVAACSRLQACFLLANACVSTLIVSVLVTQGRLGRTLMPLLLGNAAACTAIGGGILLLLANGGVADWIKRKLRRFEAGKEAGTLRPSRRQVAFAVGSCLVGRLFQTAQYGVALHAVGGHATPVTAFATQGTHLVGAAIGDLVPGQVGVTEGAFRAFAEMLGLGADPARALSIALVARVAQLGLAMACVVTAAVMSGASRKPAAADPPAGPRG